MVSLDTMVLCVNPTNMHTCCSMWQLVRLEKAGRRNIMFKHEVQSASSVRSIKAP